MRRALYQLTYVHFVEFFREPGALFWSFFFPVVLAWGLGIAFSSKMEVTRNSVLIVQDGNYMDYFEKCKANIESSSDSLLILKIGNNEKGIIREKINICNKEKADQLLMKGIISLIITIEENKLKFNFDPKNSDGMSAYQELYPLINEGRDILNDNSVNMISQKGIRYIDFLIPGIICMNLMMSVIWGISYNIIEKRSKKLMRRMVATPMRKWEYLFSHFISRFIIGVLELIVMLIFSFIYFDIEITGSITSFILLFTSGFFCFAGIAVVVSSRTSNTYIANGLINAVVMPMMLLSGIYFSYHNFPELAINFIKILPLTIFADQARAIFIEGAGFVDSIQSILILFTTGTIFFFIGLKIFKWY